MANPKVKFTTSKGDIVCELFEDQAPNTVASIITLAEDGFYEGMSFHRVIPGFMAQGGCPNTKEGANGMPGTGGPGYQTKCEINSNKHVGRGVLSMANAGKNTNGSQFFLCFVETHYLDPAHTVFGQVVEGLEVLDALEEIGTPSGRTKETVTFNIEVISKNDHDYKVEKN